MATADETGAVVVPPSLANTVFVAVVAHLHARTRDGGATLTPEARTLLRDLNRAASHPVSPTKPAGGEPANLMLGMGEAAALIGCTPQWARRLAARGEIPGAQRVGRIWLVPSTSLDAFRHEREEAPHAEGESAGEGGEGRDRAEEHQRDTAGA
ncbi:helix-turn-helix domain-containing protein [Streptomyces heilongjiangensis]|uniref:Helix-turn-helix domain-containing protein n=1 Tax=Streptomyces heilongjiangensis TaxID=945052 RepID=A0ABW1B5F8_9ACTN|nr:helix-turn-helix domain-containing protein [Streptomyces heilongjiangensis]MDC2951768.1 helix-turn-helix domain-containing protein [Streptomyces heilongjiangensis]